MTLPPMRPTPHGVAAIPTPLSLTPLSLTPLAVPVVRPELHFARHGRLHSTLALRGWVLKAVAIPLSLAFAATAADRHAEWQQHQAEQRAVREAEGLAVSLVQPLTGSGDAPPSERLDELLRRIGRASQMVSPTPTRAQARVVAPGVVEIVSRAPLPDASGTAVCMAALRWAAEALPPETFGPRCVVQGS